MGDVQVRVHRGAGRLDCGCLLGLLTPQQTQCKLTSTNELLRHHVRLLDCLCKAATTGWAAQCMSTGAGPLLLYPLAAVLAGVS